MQFQVPQFIEVDQKIIGGILTMRQFVFISSGAGLILILSFVVDFLALIILGVFISAIIFVASFLKLNGRSVSSLIKAAFFYYWNPSFYLWHSEDEYESSAKEILTSVSEFPKTQKKVVVESPIIAQEKFNPFQNIITDNKPQIKGGSPKNPLKALVSETITELTEKEEQISGQIQNIIGRISTRLKHPEKKIQIQETAIPISKTPTTQLKSAGEVITNPEVAKVYPNIKEDENSIIKEGVIKQSREVQPQKIENVIHKESRLENSNIETIDRVKTYLNIKPESESQIKPEKKEQEVVVPIASAPVKPKKEINEVLVPEKTIKIYQNIKPEITTPISEAPIKQEKVAEVRLEIPETTKKYSDVKIEKEINIKEKKPQPQAQTTISKTFAKLSATEERERLKLSGHIQNLWEKIATSRDLIPKRERHINIFQKERMEAEFQEMRKANGDIETARHVDFK